MRFAVASLRLGRPSGVDMKRVSIALVGPVPAGLNGNQQPAIEEAIGETLTVDSFQALVGAGAASLSCLP